MAQDYNSQLVQDTTARATADANAAYQQGMLELGREDLAFKKAQQAWKETFDKAGLTGMYEGAYTMPTQQWFAQQFGTWGTPTAGQQTLGAVRQGADIAAQQAGLYGRAMGTGGELAGPETLAAQQQRWQQGFSQQEYEAAERQRQQQNAQNYLQMLSSLRGPADWAKYQQVLGATPGGMRDLAAAAMGQYIPGGGATTGVQPQAVSLQSMMGQIAGGGYGQGGAAGPLNAQQTWQNAAYQTQPQAGAQQTYQALQGGLNTQQQQAQQAYQQQAQGGGTNMYGANQPQAGQPALAQTPQQQQNLPAPNQIAPQAWRNMAPSQQQMLLGQYEAEGWHKPDVEALFAQSLPKYAANAPSAGTFRLR